jgi:hypothetical protein
MKQDVFYTFHILNGIVLGKERIFVDSLVKWVLTHKEK